MDQISTFLARLGAKCDIDARTALRMIKAALPASVALAMMQSNAVVQDYTTVIFLIPIAAMFSRSSAPRGKFLHFLFQGFMLIVFAAVSSLLMVYCCVMARKHTSPPGSTSSSSSPEDILSTPYNTAASIVAGVWVFVQIYIVHAVRARDPTLGIPVSMHCMVFFVAATEAPDYTSVPAGLALVRRLLVAMLTGLALATATNLLIFPETSRDLVRKLIAQYIATLQHTLKVHATYFESMEEVDMFVRANTLNLTEEKALYRAKADATREAGRQVSRMHGTLSNEIPFASREIAYGKLGSEEFGLIFKQLSATMLPIVGLSTVVDVFDRVMEWNDWIRTPEQGGIVDLENDAVHERMVRDWNAIMASEHGHFAEILEVMDEGLTHVAYRLGVVKRPKQQKNAMTTRTEIDIDIEAAKSTNNNDNNNNNSPGEDGFAKYLDHKCEVFYEARLVTLREWCDNKGIALPEDYFSHPTNQPIQLPENGPGGLPRDRMERQLYILLYVEHMLYSSGRAVLDFVRFVDERAASGKYSRNHLVIPGLKPFRKWVRGFFRLENIEGQTTAPARRHHAAGHNNNDNDNDNGNENEGEDDDDDDDDDDEHTYRHRVILDLGQAYQRRKDPEHLPPTNKLQKFGEWLRLIPMFFRSSGSQYGLRVACAALTIGTIAFVKDTHVFFIRQRLAWAMTMQTICMGPTSGQTVVNFLARSGGTVIGMVAALFIYYVPNGNMAGVIVLFFIVTTCVWWIPLKRRVLEQGGIVIMLTIIIILGSEIEAQKLGQQAVDAGGQPYYPTYLLAPYRLAVCLGGVVVAFIWTIFPYPISDHSVLRQELGTSLFTLAKCYSLVHETLIARARGDEGDMALKLSAGRKLGKARAKAYAKQTVLINKLRVYADSTKWAMQVGGRFPRAQYEDIINCMQNISNYINLVEYASRTFSSPLSHPAGSGSGGYPRTHSESAWYQDFTKLITKTYGASHQITSVLALLSASIRNAQPLPPYLQVPDPDAFSKKMKEVNEDILNICHAAEPGYAAFSVLQIASRCIVGDLERLIGLVKDLVGELDFSFHIISTDEDEKED